MGMKSKFDFELLSMYTYKFSFFLEYYFSILIFSSIHIVLLIVDIVVRHGHRRRAEK
jgi:hypothetical protein